MVAWFEKEREALQGEVEARVRRSVGTKVILGVLALGVITTAAGLLSDPVGKVISFIGGVPRARDARNISTVTQAASGQFSGLMIGNFMGYKRNEQIYVDQVITIKDCLFKMERRETPTLSVYSRDKLPNTNTLRDITTKTAFPLGYSDIIRYQSGVIDSSAADLRDITVDSHMFTVTIYHDRKPPNYYGEVAQVVQSGWEDGTVYGNYTGHEAVKDYAPPIVMTSDSIQFAVRADDPTAITKALLTLAKHCGANDVKLTGTEPF